jgi:hypothetical protein
LDAEVKIGLLNWANNNSCAAVSMLAVSQHALTTVGRTMQALDPQKEVHKGVCRMDLKWWSEQVKLLSARKSSLHRVQALEAKLQGVRSQIASISSHSRGVQFFKLHCQEQHLAHQSDTFTQPISWACVA